MRISARLRFFYLFNLAEDPRSSAFPKMPRPFLRLKVILFPALPIQMIGQAAYPDLRPPDVEFSLPIVLPR